VVFLVTSKCLISDHFRFLLRHFQFVIRHETELRSNNKPQYSSVACGHDFYWTDARTEHQFTWFSSLPPCVSYQTISASFYVTSSSLFDTKLSYEAITTHSTLLLLVVTIFIGQMPGLNTSSRGFPRYRQVSHIRPFPLPSTSLPVRYSTRNLATKQ